MELNTPMLPAIALIEVDQFAGAGSAHASASIAAGQSLDDNVKQRPAAHFADILGQTLAGPLFATWSPTPPIIATNKLTTTTSTVGTVDTNDRRDGRKRSRR